jgi:hypothetical protein
VKEEPKVEGGERYGVSEGVREKLRAKEKWSTRMTRMSRDWNVSCDSLVAGVKWREIRR